MNQIYRLVKLNHLVRGHQVKFGAALAAHLLCLRHLSVRFDPVMACNLRCRMCYFSSESFRREHGGRFRPAEVRRILAMFLPRTLQLVIGCGAEPTVYSGFEYLVGEAKRYGVPNVGLVTNGQLLTRDHLERMMSDGLDELILSTHGTRRETYEWLMTRARFDRLLDVLNTFEGLRAERRTQRPALRVNYTVCQDNLEELAGFFETFGRYRIAVLQVRPMVKMGGEYSLHLDKHIATYNRLVDELAAECRVRNVAFLANRVDPTFRAENYDSVILEAVSRHISPERVWRTDFDWRRESYDQFCRRIHWGRWLLKCAVASREEVIRLNSYGVALRYDVR